MIALDECVSAHVAMTQREHVRLVWHSPSKVLERVRPVSWTCWCRATVYELCVGGGRGFLRRTIQLDGGHEIRETLPVSISEAGVIWTVLLSGRAR